MVRDRSQEPWIPGAGIRFQFLPDDHEDVQLVRERVQDGGHNLFVLRLPLTLAGSEVKVLAVGFYPDELHSPSWGLCEQYQRSDWQDGRLIILKTLELDGFFSAAYTRDFTGHEVGDNLKKEEWHVGPVAAGVLGSVFAYVGPLNDAHITEIQRNNRSARRDLKRRANAEYLAQEIKNAQEASDERKIADSGFVDAYEDAYKDTSHYAKGNARVSGYNPRRR
jgi:hypothetical protein